MRVFFKKNIYFQPEQGYHTHNGSGSEGFLDRMRVFRTGPRSCGTGGPHSATTQPALGRKAAGKTETIAGFVLRQKVKLLQPGTL